VTDALVCFCTCPDPEVATRLARALVEARHAACVNVLPGVTSVYRWLGQVEAAAETLLVIKTTRAAFPALQAALRAQHPYELPELVAVRVDNSLPEYLTWLADATA
jgi:periplasmic divalent cation tolerance protein